MSRLIGFLLVGALLGAGSDAWAVNERQVIKKAERFSRDKNWGRALEAYQEGLQQAPDSAVLNYDKGVVSYRKGDFDGAKTSFLKGLTSDSRALEAASSYNIGNALFKRSKELKDTDYDAALEALRQSLRYYGRALDLAPGDKDARYNYELADKVLKVLLQNKPPQAGGGQGKQNKQEQKQEQQQQKQGQGQQQQQNQEQEKQPQQQEQKKETPQQIPDARQPEANAESGRAQDHLSKEEAQMLVANYGQEGPRQEINREQIPNEKEVQKNW